MVQNGLGSLDLYSGKHFQLIPLNSWPLQVWILSATGMNHTNLADPQGQHICGHTMSLVFGKDPEKFPGEGHLVSSSLRWPPIAEFHKLFSFENIPCAPALKETTAPYRSDDRSHVTYSTLQHEQIQKETGNKIGHQAG